MITSRAPSASSRGLLIASPKLDTTKAFFAAEVGRQNGPFDNPEGWDRYKLFNKVTFQLTPTSAFTVGESSYSGNWHGSGQIPARAVEQGAVTRFGSIDPNEGGSTARHQLFLVYKMRPTEKSEIQALAYVGVYRFDLYSNFTLYLKNPDDGDEIQQVDRRPFYGGKVSYRVLHELGGVRFDTTIGGDVRSDDIHEELWSTRQRIETKQIRGNAVHETMTGAFVNEEISPARWLRMNVGGRADLLSFAVDNALQGSTDPTNPRSGVDGAHQLSPKASLVGRTLASASRDATVRLWDLSRIDEAASSTPSRVLRGHSDAVRCVAYSSDGRRLATASKDATLRLWDALTGEPITPPITGHRLFVRWVAFSPDGRIVASASDDGDVRPWDGVTGAPIGGPLTGHTDWVQCVAFSPDGSALASASGHPGHERAVRLWDVATGQARGGPPPRSRSADHLGRVQPRRRVPRVIEPGWDGAHLGPAHGRAAPDACLTGSPPVLERMPSISQHRAARAARPARPASARVAVGAAATPCAASPSRAQRARVTRRSSAPSPRWLSSRRGSRASRRSPTPTA